jgi:CRP/FNR family transcriptional regulator, cyclic AMP receptor protein
MDCWESTLSNWRLVVEQYAAAAVDTAKGIFAELPQGCSIVRSPKNRPLYFQGDPADCVYYVEAGKLKGTVASASGKEIIVGIYGPGDFCGEECLDKNLSRSMTLTSLTECELKSIACSSILHAISKNAEFSRLFISRMVRQQIRLREDFADVLLNPIERRLARLLLILARRDGEAGSELVIASISQEMLAGMLGTSRTHINHFMNKFRQLGFIDYDDRITINQSLVGMLSCKESTN